MNLDRKLLQTLQRFQAMQRARVHSLTKTRSMTGFELEKRNDQNYGLSGASCFLLHARIVRILEVRNDRSIISSGSLDFSDESATWWGVQVVLFLKLIVGLTTTPISRQASSAIFSDPEFLVLELEYCVPNLLESIGLVGLKKVRFRFCICGRSTMFEFLLIH